MVLRSSQSPKPILDIATFVPDRKVDDADDGGSRDRAKTDFSSPERLKRGLSVEQVDHFQKLQSSGAVRIVSDGYLPEDKVLSQVDKLFNRTHSKKKAIRERAFPLKAAAAGLSIAIESAKASRQEDKRHILNFLTGSPDLDAAHPSQHPAYDTVNAALRSRFALAVL